MCFISQTAVVTLHRLRKLGGSGGWHPPLLQRASLTDNSIPKAELTSSLSQAIAAAAASSGRHALTHVHLLLVMKFNYHSTEPSHLERDSIMCLLSVGPMMLYGWLADEIREIPLQIVS